MFEQSTELVHCQQSHGPGPGVHVLSCHDEDTLWTHPVLSWAAVQLYTLEMEHTGTCLTTDDNTLLVTYPTIRVIQCVQTIGVLFCVPPSFS